VVASIDLAGALLMPLVESGAFGFKGAHGLVCRGGGVADHGASHLRFRFEEGDFELLLAARDHGVRGVLDRLERDVLDGVGRFVRADPSAIRAGYLYREDPAEGGGEVHRTCLLAEAAIGERRAVRSSVLPARSPMRARMAAVDSCADGVPTKIRWRA